MPTDSKEPKDYSIIFYCKDCEEVVDTERVGKKYVYRCRKCGTKNVAFGTKKSIYSYFHIKDEPEEIPSEGAKKEENKEVKKV